MASAVTTSQLLLYLPAATLAYVVWKIARYIDNTVQIEHPAPTRPGRNNWLSGNIHRWQVDDAAWIDTYGSTFRFKDWFCADALYTLDAKALNHALTHSSNYPKPGTVAFMLGEIFGHGLLIVEGDQHRQQRRIMNPAFGPAQIRELESIFVEKAHELKNVWKARTLMSQDAVTIDVASDMSKTALDMIGLAGFNYPLNSLDESGKPNELNAAFTSVFGALTGGGRGTVYTLLLHHLVPLSRYLPGEVTRRVGMQLIREKKADVVKAMSSGKESSEVLGSRDLLTLLIKANMNSNIPEHQRLSDEDVLAQVPTFLIAGHETTSYGMTWCLFALAQVPEVQQKLREELLAVETETPSMDELNALPYLDAVVRETLRVHPPVRHTVRVALKDDVIPFGTPFYDRHGWVRDCVRMRKGMQVIIPIQTINTSKPVWGEDASEFRPDRWEKRPDAAQSVPGVWGNLMTFLGGPHACIGYRFALMEMKALLFVLVRSFTFELALPAEDIIKKSAIVQRPYIRDALEKGNQLPLRVKLYKPI